jgi:predicted amidohydrolase
MPAPGARSLAAAQTRPVAGDVEANLEQHLRIAAAAAREGARVVVFSELSLIGYELGLAPELAFTENDARLAPLREAASGHGVTLVVGAPVRLGERLHIAAFIVTPGGGLDLYTKHHLGAFPSSASPDGIVPPAEATVFHPGERDPLVRVGDHLAAVAVCADIGRPAHPERAAARGATLYLASTFVIPADFPNDAANLARYAARHAMAVVFSNYGAATGGLPPAGRSAIWSPDGDLVVELEPAGAGLAIAIEDDAGWRSRAVMLAGV